MRRTDVIVFDRVSDLPQFELYGLTWEEMRAVFQHRYKTAGRPQDKLRAWLDDHRIGAKSHDPEQRIFQLDWWGMCSLMQEAAVWRDEAHPPREDTA